MGTGRRALVLGKCWATGAGGQECGWGSPMGARERTWLPALAKRCGVCQVRVEGSLAEPRLGLLRKRAAAASPSSYPRTTDGVP